MKPFLVRSCMAGLLVFLMAGPSWGQKTGSQGSPGAVGSRGSAPTLGVPHAQSSIPQMQSPVYVNGRVLLDSGQPVPEHVPVGLFCGTRQVQVIDTDSKGYFQFTLGAGPQSNFDMSASNDDTFGDGTTLPGGSLISSGGNLMGCDLQISLSGYQPMSKLITDPADVGGINVGTLLLHRIVGVQGSAISVTSLLVPRGARKEFDKAEKDVRGNHLQSATQHLEKAVAQYDKFAAAWTELGRIYANGHQMEKARQAFSKAIAADPQYIPPYIGLAGLQLQNQQYESAIDTAGKALTLDPGIGLATYIQALGYFKLNRVDDAEKSAQEVEKEPHQNIPQLRVLLARIYVQKQDYSDALNEMRAYLKESPEGPFAQEVKQNLEGLEKFVSARDADPLPPPATDQPAPKP
jgi:Flp pilus assembly protein TadD